MKIAICSAGPGLDDQAHDLFGRCDYFLIIDLETGETKAVKTNLRHLQPAQEQPVHRSYSMKVWKRL